MKTTITLLSALFMGITLLATQGCAHTQRAPEPQPAPAPAPQPEFAQLTMDNFEKEVLESSVPVLIYVCHKDRGACKAEEPSLRQVAVEYKGRVKFARVEMSEQLPLALALGVTSMQDLPLHILVKDGKALDAYAGVLSADELRAALETLFVQPGAPPNSAGLD